MSFMLHKWLSALTDGQVVEMKWTVLIFQPEICLLIHIGHILKVRTCVSVFERCADMHCLSGGFFLSFSHSTPPPKDFLSSLAL